VALGGGSGKAGAGTALGAGAVNEGGSVRVSRMSAILSGFRSSLAQLWPVFKKWTKIVSTHILKSEGIVIRTI
jgi:hypothetical protein